ncbi:MAG: MFS transporter [Alphaproteobacteria bacterium]|jgi:MFS family permease|nr:MFS transporter [Alphaproteobacteria bacterium]MBO6863966.1 MFS transporter [Alphaproteobacteria bacterium]MEC9267877.1 MFS transporter [Pseudomonadota bacterium]
MTDTSAKPAPVAANGYVLPRTAPPIAVSGLILSMALIAVGGGLIFAYIPIRLGSLGFSPSSAGWILTSMAAGGFVGCLGTGPMVKRVGHARAYMTLAAILILSHLTLALTVDPMLWMGARAGYGLAATGLFIISQSWLNDACPNEWRGRVMAIFYMAYVLCIGLGGFLITFVDIESGVAPQLAIFFVTLAILPVGLTNLKAPLPPEYVTVSFRGVWRISPVGLAGLLAVGGLSMLVQGFAPIYANAIGYSKDEIGLMLFLMQFGMIAVQMPLGALSDRMDRRKVLIMACVLVLIFAGITSQVGGEIGLWVMIALFGVWAGATETIYAVANAHANDRAEPQYYVALSMTMLFAWSLSGFVLPGAASFLTDIYGAKAFMYVAMVIALVYGLFVAYRMTRREGVPVEAQEAYEPRAAQAAYAPELYAPVTEEDIDQEVPR